jgi:hypothetical protein
LLLPSFSFSSSSSSSSSSFAAASSSSSSSSSSSCYHLIKSPKHTTVNSPRDGGDNSTHSNSPRDTNNPTAAATATATDPYMYPDNTKAASDWDVSKGSDLSHRDDDLSSVGIEGGGSSSPRGFDRVMAFEGASPSPPSVRTYRHQHPSINPSPDNQ